MMAKSNKQMVRLPTSKMEISKQRIFIIYNNILPTSITAEVGRS
jgi:hypothetical protein